MKLSVCDDSQQWDEMVQSMGGHPLQLWGWGEVKSAHRWKAYRLLATDEAGETLGGAQVLQRPLPKPFGSMLYVPRGPVGDPAVILPAIADYCRKNFTATHISVEPHQTSELDIKGWSRVQKALLLAQTIWIDLSKSEDELMVDMTKKTRQYIRKSSNDGVSVRASTADDFGAIMGIYKQTADRAGFGLHDQQYYLDIQSMMGDSSRIFVAEAEGKVVAFAWLVVSKDIAFELYGGMNEQGQQKRANYCLKWHAITTLKGEGVRTYDVNGLLNDGVSTFKRGFADTEITLAGTYDYRLSIWYPIWQHAFPIAKGLLQKMKALRK